jgi:phage shock protein E
MTPAFGLGSISDLQSIIAAGAFLVDVRTAEEFAQGHVKGAVNIPLNTLQSQLSQFENRKHTVVFCLSGNRSGQAKMILEQNGFKNVINGGSWIYIDQFVQ